MERLEKERTSAGVKGPLGDNAETRDSAGDIILEARESAGETILDEVYIDWLGGIVSE